MEIKHNVNRAAGLVGHLLAFSRRQTLLPVVFHFTEILPDLSRLLKRLIGFRITLEVKHDRDLWLVKADRTQFEQVIINLAMNARDAMPQGGELLIRTANIAASATSELGDTTIPSADYVMIEITDTGTGIAPEVLDKIFQPFFTTKEVGKGTGLGLSMVYGFVKQSGGFILCDSKPGEGTRFRILLPRHIPEAGERVVKADAAAPAKPSADLSGQGTILLVEDEDAVRAFGARALTQRGYRVLEAATGVEALSLLETEAVDLIVSDVVMPEMDGPTLLGEARARGITSRFIFVSGYAEEAFRKNLPEGEEFGFLPKPFSLKQLTETVKDSLG
jgi:two-component system cell cycle sensor histidine kinase/response regulator CckA